MILPLFSDIKGLKRYFVSNLSSLFCPHCLHKEVDPAGWTHKLIS
ncbi:hypothetical protein [Vibrio cholerae]|nr:hypothetical protein [Vibrio cholerae]CPR24589.1 hypothetical protein [Vibrio cholerae]CPR24590.1 hypothetical protein [Vibrio cholerae]